MHSERLEKKVINIQHKYKYREVTSNRIRKYGVGSFCMGFTVKCCTRFQQLYYVIVAELSFEFVFGVDTRFNSCI